MSLTSDEATRLWEALGELEGRQLAAQVEREQIRRSIVELTHAEDARNAALLAVLDEIRADLSKQRTDAAQDRAQTADRIAMLALRSGGAGLGVGGGVGTLLWWIASASGWLK